MASRSNHTVVESPEVMDSTEIQSLTIRQEETGEVISLGIYPPGSAIAASLITTFDEIERSIDKSELQPFEIGSVEECRQYADAMASDVAEAKRVEERVEPYAKLANRIHKMITSKRAELAGYAQRRIAVYDAAIVSFNRELERQEAEQAERLREQQRAEEAERLRQETKDLKDRAKKENRPDLADQARRLEQEPAREISVSLGTPSFSRTASGRVNIGSGIGIKKSYGVDILDPDAFIVAVVRPIIYREIAAQIRKDAGKKGEPLALKLEAAAGGMPQIPLAMVEPSEKVMTKYVDNAEGRVNWTGVAVIEKDKTTKRASPAKRREVGF